MKILIFVLCGMMLCTTVGAKEIICPGCGGSGMAWIPTGEKSYITDDGYSYGTIPVGEIQICPLCKGKGCVKTGWGAREHNKKLNR